MARHTFAALVVGASFIALAVVFILNLSQPRTLVWYTKTAAIAGSEWILSVLLHRLLLHPLAKYPGPLVAALTDWYVVFWIAHGGRHLELHKQHARHGKYVRFGPNRLSINTAEALRDIHDVKANNSKADAYGGAKHFFGSDMSTTITDHKAHAFRRRVNVAALTPAVVKDFADVAAPHVDYFMTVMGQGAGSKANGEEGWSAGHDMSSAAAFCIGDIMGSVTFNRSWNTQREATLRHFVKDSPLGVAGIHLVGHMQSLFLFNMHKLLFRDLIKGVNHLTSISRSNALWRMSQEDMDCRDIWSSLIKSRDPKTGAGFTKEELISEAGMFIVAGTDTAITAICSTIFYLVHNPRVLERLSDEVRAAFPLPDGSDRRKASEVECPIVWASAELQGLPYLHACIDEAMRLSPPISSILPRKVGPGGQLVDGEFFPEGVNLGVNHYSLHHNEDYFPEALTYAPERWLPNEKDGQAAMPRQPAVAEPTAFTPFGVGRYSCIGKNLAYQELYYILARIVWLFDLRQEPGNTRGEGFSHDGEGRGCKSEYQLYDRYVSGQDGPVIQFRYREELRP